VPAGLQFNLELWKRERPRAECLREAPLEVEEAQQTPLILGNPELANEQPRVARKPVWESLFPFSRGLALASDGDVWDRPVGSVGGNLRAHDNSGFVM
jgi:hypothetical protein